MDKEIKKIVLAYSGGLDTSVAIRWLREEYNCEVIAYCADIGQGDDFNEIKEKALKTGAVKVYVDDLKSEFVKEYIFPMLRANARYESGYLLGTSIARPLIARRQIEIARKENADAVAHGATGKGNDQVRFELTYLFMEPKIKIIAPWREWRFKSRKELIEYTISYNIPITVTYEKPYSSDRNLFHISYEGGILEDPWIEPPEDIFLLTRSIDESPDKPTYIEIGFRQGDPISLNDREIDAVELLSELNELGGINGIGRIDMVENRYVGIKSRGVYETPGGTILHIAHQAIESITMDREVMHLRDSLIPRYSELVYYGYWFSDERMALQKIMDEAQKDITGTVRIKLHKGNSIVVGRTSPNSKYSPEFATFEKDDVYNQRDAEGFIKLNALRLQNQKNIGVKKD
ncbi:MAG: argininosuccinate synthase [Nitrospirota bacterium]